MRRIVAPDGLIGLCHICDELDTLDDAGRCWECSSHGKPVTRWTRIDGTQIPIAEMETSHLGNTLRMLGRKAERGDLSPYEERAQLALQIEYDSRADEIGRDASLLRMLLAKAKDGDEC